MTEPLYRYTAALKSNPLDVSSRISWGGNEPDALVARARANRVAGEVVVLTDYEAGQQWTVSGDGTRSAT